VTRGTSRLAGLSDGVFAITITLLMVVAFLPFATSVLAKALPARGHLSRRRT
jgi:uncharacterized membrane protein